MIENHFPLSNLKEIKSTSPKLKNDTAANDIRRRNHASLLMMPPRHQTGRCKNHSHYLYLRFKTEMSFSFHDMYYELWNNASICRSPTFCCCSKGNNDLTVSKDWAVTSFCDEGVCLDWQNTHLSGLPSFFFIFGVSKSS